MDVMEAYLALAVGPLAAVPIQWVYLKAGARYDLGASLLMAIGFLFATAVGSQAASFPSSLLLGVALLAVALVVIRLLVLATSSAMRFTVVSLAQMWATVPLLDFLLLEREEIPGIYIGRVLTGYSAITLSAILAITLFFAVRLLKLDLHLRALTENRESYSVLIGSPFILAARLEGLALIAYLGAGFLVRLSRDNLASSDFGSETLWIVLCAAVIRQVTTRRPMQALLALLLAPLGITLLRLVANSVMPATYSQITAFALLALALAWVAWRDGKDLRVSRSQA